MTMRSIPVAVAVTTAVVLIGLMVRRARAKSIGDGRVELAVVPTSGFDPSVEEIIRYAAHLVRTRRLRDVVAGRRGRTVRLSLRSVGEGQLVQTIDVAESAAAMVRRHPLDGVEMVTLDELDRRIAGVVGTDSSQPDATASESRCGVSADTEGAQRQHPPGLTEPPTPDQVDSPAASATTVAQEGERHLRSVGVAATTDPVDVDVPVVWPSIGGEGRQSDE